MNGDVVALPVVTLPAAMGVLMLQSEPSGALILIDDKPTGQQTPTRMALPAGKHKVTFQKGDFKASQEVEVKDGDLRYLTMTLTQ